MPPLLASSSAASQWTWMLSTTIPRTIVSPITCQLGRRLLVPSSYGFQPLMGRRGLAQTTHKQPTSKPPSFRKDLFTIPNILTMTRIATAPLIGYYILKGQTTWAAGLFTYSCITDFVDGWIARKFNQKSVVGSIIDPLADKLLMTVSTVALSITHTMPTVVAIAIIGRDVMLSAMACYYRYKSLAPPKTFANFIDIQGNPTITVLPNMLGKYNTALQMVYIAGLVLKPVVDPYADLSTTFDVLGAVVTVTTLASGYSYLFGKHAFKYVK